MMIRVFLLVAVLICSIFITGGLAPIRSCAAELTRFQKAELLDKAEAALIWFHTLGDEDVKNRIPAQEYREKIAPTELIQAAALLYSYRETEKTALAEKLLPFLPYYRLTPEEMFEIHDLLGETDLPDLAEIQTSDLGRITVEANRFRTESLNSAEKVVLFQEPATALELMKVVDILSGVGRPVLVRHYLRKYLAGTPASTPEESAKIVETIGTQRLMQIAIHPEFVPLGKEAVAKIIDSAKEHWQDEERIAEALKETDWFIDGSREEFTEPVTSVRVAALPALRVLWKGDQISVQQVFEKLATIEDDNEADQLVAVLLSLRPDMKEALAAVLASGNQTLRFHAARGLAASVTPQEAFLLYHFLFYGYPETETETVKNILQQRRITIPSQEQAAAILHERGNDYFEKRRPLRVDADGKVTVWNWVWYSPQPGEPIDYSNDRDNVQPSSFGNIETAYKYLAERYYRQSVECLPLTSVNYKAHQLAFAIARLEYFGHRNAIHARDINMDVVLGELVSDKHPNLAKEIAATRPSTEQLLEASLEKNCFYAASAAIYGLGERGNADLLQSTNGKPRVLVQATVAKDRRVRFAALEAIMKLTANNPEVALRSTPGSLSPFAGSSLVAETLVWFSKSEGESVLLSGHPQTASAIRTANLFLGLGYKTEVATTCRELFQLAAATPDVEVVVVDVRTTQPPVGQFVQMMRQDARTAEIPIAVLDGRRRTADGSGDVVVPLAPAADRRQPSAVSLALTYPRLADAQTAEWVLHDLFAKTVSARPWAGKEERLAQAKQALVWLREIKLAELESSVKIYHFEDFDLVVLHALHSERRVVEGLQLAAVVKSAALQSAIYEIAANAVYPMWLREQAGAAFAESVERFGVLLRGQQIQRLYDRYNQSETESKESQELLGRLIDVIEK